MIKLYLNCMKHALKNKFLLLFVVLSIAAAMFCIDMTLASAQNEYESTLNINSLSSVAMFFDSETIQTDEIDQTLNSLFPTELRNVIYITKTDDGTTLIGWQGYNQTNWFPHINGRFFSFDEVENEAKVAYIPTDDYGKLGSDENGNIKIDIDGESYSVIGAGWCNPYNFKSAISEDSPQDIFVSDFAKDYTFRIIPYTTFFQNYSPELVLIHFEHPSFSFLKEKKAVLERYFESAAVTMPKENSDEYLLTQKAVRAAIGVVLSLLLFVSVIGIMQEWLKINSNRYYVFVLCGAGQRKIVFLILAEWLTYTVIGLLLSLGIQYCCLPLLSEIGAGYMPKLAEIAAQLILFYLVAVLLLLKKIKTITAVSRRGGAL